MTELALTRIFSVVMYYHFAFLAISIALVRPERERRVRVRRAATARSLSDRRAARAPSRSIYAACTIVALFCPGAPARRPQLLAAQSRADADDLRARRAAVLHRRPRRSRWRSRGSSSRINAVYAADLIGAAAGCLVLIPLLDRLGAPGRRPDRGRAGARRRRALRAAAHRARGSPASARSMLLVPLAGQLSGVAGFDVVDTKGHQGDRVLFSKWNSFSRIGVYERTHGDWSLSYTYTGPLPDTRYMDIDSAASTPILGVAPDLSNAQYLRYELTALAYHLEGARDSGLEASASVSRRPASPSPQPQHLPASPLSSSAPAAGAISRRRSSSARAHVDGVEINPIIADDVMRDRFRDFSGGIYTQSARPHRRRRRPQLRAADAGSVRRHPGVAGRHLGRDGGRRVHADREHALHRRGVQRLPRSPDRRRAC